MCRERREVGRRRSAEAGVYALLGEDFDRAGVPSPPATKISSEVIDQCFYNYVI